MGKEFATNVHELAINIDLSNLQYNLVEMYEEMRKLGLDGGDLAEYGLCDLSHSGKPCQKTAGVVKSLDDVFSSVDMFTNKFTNKFTKSG